MDILKNLIQEELNNEHLNKEENDTICLISKENLNNTSLKLSCDHTFNYYPLYCELVHKKKQYHKNYSNTLLKLNQLQCPYCRTIINNLIPYVEMPNVNKIYGINYPKKYVKYPNKCNYRYKSGKKKGQLCNKPCYHSNCKNHKEVELDFTKIIDEPSLNKLTMIQLKSICKKNKIKKFSKLNKKNLINLILKNNK